MTVFTGFSHVRHVATRQGVYSLSLDGPGVLKTSPAGRGAFDVTLLGTSQSSKLTIGLVRPRFHTEVGLMSVRNLAVRTGQIGDIVADVASLGGRLTPLTSSVNTLDFGALGRAAQIDVAGSVASMRLGSIDLGPTGHVVIAGDVNGGAVDQALSSSSSSTAKVTPAMTVQTFRLDGGRFLIGRDSSAPIVVNGDMALSHNGLFSVGRDQGALMTVHGSLVLDTGGVISVGRNLTSIKVDGDLLVNPTSSGIQVGGDLGVRDTGLTVGGFFRGQGSASAIDLSVGLNLNGLTILGGAPNQGGLRSANISVGKNLNDLNVQHGIFDSYITAGVSINNGYVGPDGVTAIQNSEIDATSSINNLTAGGDVVSGFPTGNTAGYPTRIIAGKARSTQAGAGPDQGLYVANGAINSLTINGALVDAVLAASVAPYGGDGSLPPPVPYGGTQRTSGTPPTTFSNYNAPGGLTDQGNGTAIKNYSIRSIVNGALVPTAVWDTTTDPNLHDNVLANGTITAIVTGGVTSTPHGDNNDFAGVFAVNTVGINGGSIPFSPTAS
ncbi:hypothetical protein [Aquisphaera giovannonii]|uniref:hypothetical protein n=1 Tax=Aquisphaera giovannonii TaxID=406548 RepID=UPI0011DFA5C6|nr:hypothetical protein [Aquisphaera giovannonii]